MQIESIIWAITTFITLWGIFHPAIVLIAASITSGIADPNFAGHNLRLEQEGLSGKTNRGYSEEQIESRFTEHNKDPLSDPNSMDRREQRPSQESFMGITEEQANAIIKFLNNAAPSVNGGQEIPLHTKFEKLWKAWEMRPRN